MDIHNLWYITKIIDLIPFMFFFYFWKGMSAYVYEIHFFFFFSFFYQKKWLFGWAHLNRSAILRSTFVNFKSDKHVYVADNISKKNRCFDHRGNFYIQPTFFFIFMVSFILFMTILTPFLIFIFGKILISFTSLFLQCLFFLLDNIYNMNL